MIALWQGILVGLGLSLLLGPEIFIFLKVSLVKGTRTAVITGIGIWLSDLFFIFVTLFGLSFLLRIIEDDGFKIWIGCLGGLLLMAIGIQFFLQTGQKPVEDELKNIPTTNAKHLAKGFLINTLNPFAALFWVGTITAVGVNYKEDLSAQYLFIFGVQCTIILTDLLKIILAQKMVCWLSESTLFYLKWISGLGVFLLGLLMIIRVLI